MDREIQIKAVYKDSEFKKLIVRYKKETSSGFVWTEDEIKDLTDVIEVTKNYDYKGKPTFSIRAYGKLEEIFQ